MINDRRGRRHSLHILHGCLARHLIRWLERSERAEQFAKRCVECGCQQSRYSLSATSLPIHGAPLVVANLMFISHIKNTLKIYIIWEFSRFIDSRLVKSWNNVILYQHFRWIKRKKKQEKINVFVQRSKEIGHNRPRMVQMKENNSLKLIVEVLYCTKVLKMNKEMRDWRV